MRGSYAECKAELEHVSSLWGPLTTVSEIRVLKTELPLTARLQAYHDNASWTWEVNNHRLALVLFLWIEQNTQRRLESENKRGVYECVCILERHRDRGPIDDDVHLRATGSYGSESRSEMEVCEGGTD